jgi:hypothetical protein
MDYLTNSANQVFPFTFDTCSLDELLHLPIGADFRFVQITSRNSDDGGKHDGRSSPDSMEVSLTTKTSGYPGSVGTGDVAKNTRTRKADGLVEESEHRDRSASVE